MSGSVSQPISSANSAWSSSVVRRTRVRPKPLARNIHANSDQPVCFVMTKEEVRRSAQKDLNGESYGLNPRPTTGTSFVRPGGGSGTGAALLDRLSVSGAYDALIDTTLLHNPDHDQGSSVSKHSGNVRGGCYVVQIGLIPLVLLSCLIGRLDFRASKSAWNGGSVERA